MTGLAKVRSQNCLVSRRDGLQIAVRPLSVGLTPQEKPVAIAQVADLHSRSLMESLVTLATGNARGRSRPRKPQRAHRADVAREILAAYVNGNHLHLGVKGDLTLGRDLHGGSFPSALPWSAFLRRLRRTTSGVRG